MTCFALSCLSSYDVILYIPWSPQTPLHPLSSPLNPSAISGVKWAAAAEQASKMSRRLLLRSEIWTAAHFTSGSAAAAHFTPVLYPLSMPGTATLSDIKSELSFWPKHMHVKGLFSTNASIALVRNTFYVSKMTILDAPILDAFHFLLLMVEELGAHSPAQPATLRGQRKQPVSNWSRKLTVLKYCRVKTKVSIL